MKKYIGLIKAMPLFQGIREEDLKRLLSCLRARIARFGKNQAVFLEGDKADWIGAVLSGGVQIVREDYFGARSIVAAVGAGSLFAESFAFTETKSLPVSIFASEDSDILLLNCEKCLSPCSCSCLFHNRLIRNFLGITAEKNVLLREKIDVLSKRTTREKLMAYLSNEAKKAGSRFFEIPFNRQELADYLGVDRSAMSSELGRLKKDGVLDFTRSRFRIV